MTSINYMGLEVPYEDAATWSFISEARNLKGIFQLETDSAARILHQIKPKNISDLSLVNALNRPGAMKFATDLAAIRTGEKVPQYLHPDLEKLLSSTGGFLVFQEQTMIVSQKMAGFAANDSNTLLKALGKKDAKKMASLEQAFIEGMIKNNYSKELAEKLFSWIKDAASYSFNASHSVSYSQMGYIIAYVKVHFPLQFFTSLLNYTAYESDPINEVFECVSELSSFKIKILPPSITKLTNKFAIEDGAIRYPIGLMKSLAEKSYEKLSTLTLTQTATLDSCLESLINSGLDSRNMEAIIISGSLDGYGVDREHILFYYWFLKELQPDILNKFWHHKNGQKFSKRLIFKFLRHREVVPPKETKRAKQLELFSNEAKVAAKIKYTSYFKTEITRTKTLEATRANLKRVAVFRKNKVAARFFWEQSILGYASNYNLGPNVKTYKELELLKEGECENTIGIITDIVKKTSQRGKPYAIITVKFDKVLELGVFGFIYEGAGDGIKKDDFLKLNLRMEENSLKIESLNVINKIRDLYILNKPEKTKYAEKTNSISQ